MSCGLRLCAERSLRDLRGSLWHCGHARWEHAKACMGAALLVAQASARTSGPLGVCGRTKRTARPQNLELAELLLTCLQMINGTIPACWKCAQPRYSFDWRFLAAK